MRDNRKGTTQKNRPLAYVCVALFPCVLLVEGD